MPLTQSASSTAQHMVFTNSTDKASFIEGPCNCVNRLLKEARPEETKGDFDIKDLVARSDFNLDIFDSSSCLHLLCDSPDRKITLPKRQIQKCPRVGLTLKRYDTEKDKYWMADYRFLTFPAFHAKMKDYIIMSSLAKGNSITSTCELAAAKVAKVEDIHLHFKKGQEAAKTNTGGMRKCHKDKMTGNDWAYTYGMHTVLNKH